MKELEEKILISLVQGHCLTMDPHDTEKVRTLARLLSGDDCPVRRMVIDPVLESALPAQWNFDTKDGVTVTLTEGTPDYFTVELGASPGVDVKGEISKAQAWHAANPTKRKTKRGLLKFLVSWISRAEGKAPEGPKARDIPIEGDLF